jgi:hypothetical protein
MTPSSRFLPAVVVLAAVLATAGAGAAASAPPADSAAAKRPACKPKGSRTLAQSRFARVFQKDGSVLACVRATGKRVLLSEPDDGDFYTEEYFGKVALAGAFVAWTSETLDLSCKAACPPGYDTTAMRRLGVLNLRRRRSRVLTPDATVVGAPALSRTGRVAWASRENDSAPVVIHGSARRRQDRVLDSGAIAPRSLGIELTIVSWVRDGVERFARLR